ncbi:hypothetical protein CBR_g871 [Chara braunii]|uniref:Glutathione peroxidase n=1 Tax=Chara braunii TaxID=69332 RepID=A0A388KCR8_CHABU|nr:hypothetical protein CBR_g871 [Chara braunii]|eukprot:GBG67743.1 hypothetical protein CBR_g871 [Chara braunii]
MTSPIAASAATATTGAFASPASVRFSRAGITICSKLGGIGGAGAPGASRSCYIVRMSAASSAGGSPYPSWREGSSSSSQPDSSSSTTGLGSRSSSVLGRLIHHAAAVCAPRVGSPAVGSGIDGRTHPRTAMAAASVGGSAAAPTKGRNLHTFTVKDIDGNDVSLGDYKGKVVLIVNVASQCGLTNQNYKELVQLYEKYKDQDFVVLAFPSNQFGGQEPKSNAEIKKFAESYGTTFPMFSKVDVNGDDAAPVFKWLKLQKGGLLTDEIKWNFGKFLVDKEGTVVHRYAPTTSPLQIEEDVKKLL